MPYEAIAYTESSIITEFKVYDIVTSNATAFDISNISYKDAYNKALKQLKLLLMNNVYMIQM